MKYRRLRIAFSVTCGIACVLLVVLWVRSYWRFDGIYRLHRDGMTLAVAFNKGAVIVPRRDKMLWSPDQTTTGWKLRSTKAVGWIPDSQWMLASDNAYLAIPEWFLVLIVAALAAAPWLRWRFSLRTLLIATTFIALTLGTIIATTR